MLTENQFFSGHHLAVGAEIFQQLTSCLMLVNCWHVLYLHPRMLETLLII